MEGIESSLEIFGLLGVLAVISCRYCPFSRYTDDGYDPYKKADLQMRELIRGTTLAPKNPRTVPGVRTQGLHNNTSSNTSDSNSYTSTNRWAWTAEHFKTSRASAD